MAAKQLPQAQQALAFKALCILYETMERAKQGKVPPSMGLRLALEVLHNLGDREGEWFDREMVDGFWRAATQRSETSGTAGVGRTGEMTAPFRALARTVGLDHVPDMTWRRGAGEWA